MPVEFAELLHRARRMMSECVRQCLELSPVPELQVAGSRQARARGVAARTDVPIGSTAQRRCPRAHCRERQPRRPVLRGSPPFRVETKVSVQRCAGARSSEPLVRAGAPARAARAGGNIALGRPRRPCHIREHGDGGPSTGGQCIESTHSTGTISPAGPPPTRSVPSQLPSRCQRRRQKSAGPFAPPTRRVSWTLRMIVGPLTSSVELQLTRSQSLAVLIYWVAMLTLPECTLSMTSETLGPRPRTNSRCRESVSPSERTDRPKLYRLNIFPARPAFGRFGTGGTRGELCDKPKEEPRLGPGRSPRTRRSRVWIRLQRRPHAHLR